MFHSIPVILLLLPCSFDLSSGQSNKWFNTLLDAQNPSSVLPPETDNGVMLPFKYPFTFTHNEVFKEGWIRETSADDLPISTKVSARQTRIPKGSIGGLHWHVEAEWAYVIYGHGRATSVDTQGLAFVEDVKAGDIWIFKEGIPHAFQGLGPDGMLHVSVFNGGLSFFRLGDWLKYTPRDVLAKNFKTQESTFDNLPEEVISVFKGELPGSLEKDQAEAFNGTGQVKPLPLLFRTADMKPNVTRKGGNAKIVDARNFPATNMAAAIVTLKPGAMREMHWHTNADEWQYYIQGKARMTVFGMEGAARTMDFEEGDVGYVKLSFGHYIENTGSDTLIFMEVFPTPFFEDLSLTQWLAHTSSQMVNQHIKTGEKFIKSLPKEKAVIVP